jgi:hypothetical protein
MVWIILEFCVLPVWHFVRKSYVNTQNFSEFHTGLCEINLKNNKKKWKQISVLVKESQEGFNLAPPNFPSLKKLFLKFQI